MLLACAPCDGLTDLTRADDDDYLDWTSGSSSWM